MTGIEAIKAKNASLPVSQHDMRAYDGWKRTGNCNHAWAMYGGPAQRNGWVLAQTPDDADRYSSTGNPDCVHAFAEKSDVPNGWRIVRDWATR